MCSLELFLQQKQVRSHAHLILVHQKEQSELINSTTRLEMSLCTHLHEIGTLVSLRGCLDTSS